MAPAEADLRSRVLRLQRAKAHRPRQAAGAAHQAFLRQQLAALRALAPQLPAMPVARLRAAFEAALV